MKYYMMFFYTLLFCLSSCKVGTLTAVDGSVLNISVNPSVIGPGGSCQVKVIGFKPSGSPLPNGTVIFFSTDFGAIPSSGKIRDGYVVVTYTAPAGRSGTAKIEASSGINSDNGANKVETTILVGSTAVQYVDLSASPGSLPPGGGQVTLSAFLKDENHNPVPGVPVTFSVSSGTITDYGKGFMSDSNGVVRAYLNTLETSDVTVYAGSISGTIKVAVTDNSAPVADFTFSPASPKVGETVYFNGYGSTDDDGYINKYYWDFGDGHSGSGVKVSHIFNSDTSYSVTLVVEDNYGLTGAKSVTIKVSNGDSPIASFTATPQGSKKVVFDASLSTDKDDSIIKFEWTFGDGQSGTGLTVVHDYSNTGTYNVVLKVTDEKGNTGTAQQSVVVN